MVDGWIAALVAPPRRLRRRAGAARSRLCNARSGWRCGPTSCCCRSRTPVCTTTSTRAAGCPRLLQRALECYTNPFGIIIWRVFSVDLVNFFIRVEREPRAGGTRADVAPLGTWPRFNHVGEMICLTSLFTTLKYYPSNDATLPRAAAALRAHGAARPGRLVLVFEYRQRRQARTDRIRVGARRPSTASIVAAATVDERILDPTFSPRAAHAGVAGARRRDARQLRAR